MVILRSFLSKISISFFGDAKLQFFFFFDCFGLVIDVKYLRSYQQKHKGLGGGRSVKSEILYVGQLAHAEKK